MGHDLVKFRERAALFRDPHLNLVRCIMLHVAERRDATDSFNLRLLSHLHEFEWITTGVFTDLRLDELLVTSEDTNHFLDFLDHCAGFVCSRGTTLDPTFLREMVGDSDQWNCDVPVEYPLMGLGRLANLIVGVFPAVWYGDKNTWTNDDLSRRMKQQRIYEVRRATNHEMDRSRG